MDVERIQKVNNLALDLMKQGLAQDRDEAVEKAEKIFKERDTEDYANIRETMGQDKPKEEPKTTTQTSQSELSEDKIKDIMEKNTTFIIKKFKEFQEKLDSMQKEIEFLRNTSQRGPAVREIVTNEAKEVPPPVQEEPKSEVRPEQKSNGGSSDHPRSGNYKEDDVSIEKFFYMGNK